jgi:hypothetical protein
VEAEALMTQIRFWCISVPEAVVLCLILLTLVRSGQRKLVLWRRARRLRKLKERRAKTLAEMGETPQVG